ncbi:MAG: toll/interleukin-1 receptor domain-containing protein, partial [Bacteroidaceae bacterium]|nr:toll/interleukin-1 receptor domain-containing protein [Bacteroidaceae bacterium]
MEKEFKYYAFISYNSKDMAWGKRLQRKLENYRMPATLCSQRGWKRKPINPVFFAPTDIQPGELDEELKGRLRASKNLIVICSPNSAQSEWVGKEIKYFHELGRDKEIYFFIVAGIPNSGNAATECFNPVIDKLGLPEILGANIHEKIYRWAWMNRERAYVQLISKLLGVE